MSAERLKGRNVMETQYVPAILYHQVLTDDSPMYTPKAAEGRPYGKGFPSGVIYLADFVQQMDFLAERGFTAVTHDQLYQWLKGDQELGPNPIVIGFDDHSMVSCANALPVMRERGLVATMFVISGLADGDPSLGASWAVQPPRMRWRELEKLIDAGWEIGAHTYSHPFLTAVPEGVEGDEQIMHELVRGKTDIAANLGVNPRHFAYPGECWNERVELMVKQVFDSARLFSAQGRAEYVTSQTDPYRLPTMNINYQLSFEDFKRLVCRTDPDYEYYSGS